MAAAAVRLSLKVMGGKLLWLEGQIDDAKNHCKFTARGVSN
jgi:hypothetical protein